MAKEPVSEQDDQEGPRNFGVFLRTVEGGSFEIELSDTLYRMTEDLGKHVSQYGGKAKGEIAIVLKFEHDQKGQVQVMTEVKTKTPKAKRAATPFWVTRGGNLVDHNPKQTRLKFKDVSAPPQQPPRDVGATPAARSV